MRFNSTALFLLINFFCILFMVGQTPKTSNAVEIYNDIEKLNTLASVLYVAAHPDDENTRLISYMSNKLKARVGYLSLTRGDGGQNLIGSELRELLGVIRTQELLAARRIDGGEQFFTRANDFGYSKHPDEAFSIWNKEAVVNDAVWTIRNFKPDVIINRFDHRSPGTTHGHHTASAMASIAAFSLAGKSSYATEQLKDTETWQPERQFFNTSWWFYGSQDKFDNADKSNLISFDIGTFYPESGLSNNEIATKASSQHLSQGFGRLSQRGSSTEYIELIEGTMPMTGDVFEGIDTSWNRVEGGAEIGEILTAVQKNFNFKDPATHLPNLVKAYRLIQSLNDDHWRDIKIKEITQIISACAGLYVDFKAESPNASPGGTTSLSVEIISRNSSEFMLTDVKVNQISLSEVESQRLIKNQALRFDTIYKIDESVPYSVPYWLTEKGTLGLYQVNNQKLIGQPQTPRSLVGSVTFDIYGESFSVEKEIIYHYALPDKGEIYQPFEIVPEVDVSISSKSFLFANSSPQTVTVTVTAHEDQVNGTAGIKVPEDWIISPLSSPFDITTKGASQKLEFLLSPPRTSSEAQLTGYALIENEVFEHELVEIDYDHIPLQTVMRPSQAKAVRLDIKTVPLNIAYITGAGDTTIEGLSRVGLSADDLDVNDITDELLSNYDVVILGIRAYNTVDELKYKQASLFRFVENGGTMLVQYNVSRGLVVDQVAPLTLELSRDRVTDEFSPIEILFPDHAVMNYPNRLSLADFDGWVQERGLYFPNNWDKAFQPLLRMNDLNETPTDGSILIAPFGKGHFIYTGLSFFRQFPESVPGAYRFFVNLISIGKFEK